MLYFRDRRGTAILVFEQRLYADSSLWRPKSYILCEHSLNNYLIAKKTNQQTSRQADEQKIHFNLKPLEVNSGLIL